MQILLQYKKRFSFAKRTIGETFSHILVTTDNHSKADWEHFFSSFHHPKVTVISYDSDNLGDYINNLEKLSLVIYDDLSQAHFRKCSPFILRTLNIAAHHLNLVVFFTAQEIISTQLSCLLSLVQEIHLLSETASCYRILKYLSQRYFENSDKYLFEKARREAGLFDDKFICIFLNRPVYDRNNFILAFNLTANKNTWPLIMINDDAVQSEQIWVDWDQKNGLNWRIPTEPDSFIQVSAEETANLIMCNDPGLIDVLPECRDDPENAGKYVMVPKGVYSRIYASISQKQPIMNDAENGDDVDQEMRFQQLQTRLFERIKLNLPPKKVKNGERLGTCILQCGFFDFSNNLYGSTFMLHKSVRTIKDAALVHFLQATQLEIERIKVNTIDFLSEVTKASTAFKTKKKKDPQQKKMELIFKLCTKLLFICDCPRHIVINTKYHHL